MHERCWSFDHYHAEFSIYLNGKQCFESAVCLLFERDDSLLATEKQPSTVLVSRA